MLQCNYRKDGSMNTQIFSVRIPTQLVEVLDKIAKEHEWSRNYVVKKFLSEKCYELSGDSAA